MAKTAKYLTEAQKNFIIDEFMDRGDLRMVIISTFIWGCVRPSDVIKLRKEDLYTVDGEVRKELDFVEGKRKKRRLIPLRNNRLEKLLIDYYKVVRELPIDSPIFYAKKTGNQIDHSALKKIFRQFIGRRGIEQCSPYSFRKGGARWLYCKRGVPLDNIRDMMGHSNNRTTLRYISVNPVDVQKTQGMLFE